MFVKIKKSSLNEFYWKLVVSPISENYFHLWPDSHYIEDWFDVKMYLKNDLVNSWDETVVEAVFENISWFDKWYSEFYFRYLKTKIEVISALYAKKEFDWKLTWSRDFVKAWEKVVIYLKIRKK